MKGPKFLFCVLYALVAVSLYAESTSGIKHVSGRRIHILCHNNELFRLLS